MPENLVPQPFDALGWQAQVETRLSALEARPQVIPPVPLAAAPLSAYPSADWYQPVTAGSWTVYWQAQVSRWSHQALWAVVPWRTAAATTGELRIEASFSTTSSAVSLAAGSSGTATFRWLHSQVIWSPSASGAAWVTAYRSSGAGDVEIGYPYLALLDPAGATLAGI